jgi:hypothetical protein
MFGVMDDGEVFVVVADKLIFECGQYDDIAEMTDTMEFPNHYIDEVHEATCFKMVNEGRSKVIWKRPEPKVEEVESEEGKVTITEEEFEEVVKKANQKFMEISKQCPTPNDPIIELAMGLSNMAFGALIGAVLFGKEIN